MEIWYFINFLNFNVEGKYKFWQVQEKYQKNHERY